ncbi:MAG: HAD family hydrolase [Chitinophagaceae bacterium]|nr:HAD family hydrolase [Chitinophagaceae bacterium]MCW5928619.1 HAD family hydrolase [Chitinophagaceae bacterium]
MTEKKSYYIFDLDDTLFREIDFLKSGYNHIIKNFPVEDKRSVLLKEMMDRYYRKENVFDWLTEVFAEENLTASKESFLKQYREHFPDIHLNEDAAAFLKKIRDKKILAGLITDGRSVTQRNKLKALGIETFFKDIIISEEFGFEKPNPANFLYFVEKYPGYNFCYIGDNTRKDFIVPKQLGWKIFCLKDSGSNIHMQDLTGFAPEEIISSLREVPII